MIRDLKEWTIERGYNFQNYESLIDIIEKDPESLYMLFLKSKKSLSSSKEIEEAKNTSNELISFYYSLKRDKKIDSLFETKILRFKDFFLI